MSAWEGSKLQERWQDEKQRKIDLLAQKLAPVWMTVTSPQEMPTTTHWAIIRYPESGIEYVAFSSRSDWEKVIADLETGIVREPYTALEVKPAAITRTIQVTV